MKKLGLILLVDDSDEFRKACSICLSHAGYDVLQAATGGEGLELTRKHLPELVLLDVRLPDLSGIEICRKIKADPALKNVFIALCSGEATGPEDKATGLECGADDYIVKPFGFRELLVRLQTLLRLRNTTAALRSSEAHHRRLIDILPDAVFLVHPKGQLTAVNSQAVTMLGYASVEELIPKSIYEITPVGEHKRIKKDIGLALRVGMIRNAEYFMLKKDATCFQVELSATVSLGFNNQSAGLLCVVRDVTENKRAQQALQASEERFRQLADHIEEAFWMSNADKSEMIYISPAYEKIWGRTCGSLYDSPKSWIAAIHPEDRDRVSADAFKRQVDGEYDETYRIIRPDGSIRWIQDRAFPIRDSSGNVYRIVGIADDITKRKQAWDSLGESEARKQAIMEAALDGIITIDHKGQIVELNSAAERILGISHSKLIRGNVIEIIPEIFKPWFQNGLANSFAGNKGPIQGSHIEMPALRSDGSQFAAEITIATIVLAGKRMFTLYLRDITQRKRAEAELRSLPQHIIKAQEDERSRIAQELHDGINQLVASVKMRLHKVEESLPKMKPAAREILRRCDDLLVKVLQENRRIAHNLRPTELDNLGLAAACNNFCREVQLRTNLKFQCELIAPGRRLPPDVELQLFRIVQEAINNIEKHAKAKSVSLQIRLRQGVAIVKIQDDGCGFDVKTARNSSKAGHGLGLTNMQERAMSLGGACKLTSLKGGGTTIVATVPLEGGRHFGLGKFRKGRYLPLSSTQPTAK